jgi:RNA polymerase sigma-70 factor (ECF subfamily)
MAAAPTKTDAGLVARLQERDRAAWDELYREYEERLFRFAYRLTGNEHDAADLVQETFVRVLVRLDRLDPDRPDLSSYLFKTAQNLFLSERARGRRTEVVDEVPEPSVPAPIEDDPQRSTLLHGQQEEVRVANAKLAPRQRLVLALCELEDRSYAEIGELVGLNENAVAQLISRARQNLRHELRLVQVDRSRLPAECQALLPKLSAFLDGQLKGEPRALLVAHVAACEHCQRALGEMEEARRRYRLLIPPVLGGAALKEQVEDALAAHGYAQPPPSGPPSRPPGARAPRGRIAGAVAGGLVVAAIGVGVALLVTRGAEQTAATFTPPEPTSASDAAVSPSSEQPTTEPEVAAVKDVAAQPVALAVTILERPPDRTRSARAAFAFETGGDPAEIRCRLDGAGFEPCTSPVAYRGLEPGVHHFVVRVTASGASPASAADEWTVVEEASEEGGETVEAASAGGDGAATASVEAAPATETASQDEAAEAGDSEPQDERKKPPRDTTPPAVSITSTPPAATRKTVAVFRFSANEPVSRVECSLDGGGYSRCYTPTRYDVGIGGHSFCVRAIDKAGNVGGPACASWTVEAKPEPAQPPEPTQPPEQQTTPPESSGGEQPPAGGGGDDERDEPPNCDQPAILDPC